MKYWIYRLTINKRKRKLQQYRTRILKIPHIVIIGRWSKEHSFCALWKLRSSRRIEKTFFMRSYYIKISWFIRLGLKIKYYYLHCSFTAVFKILQVVLGLLILTFDGNLPEIVFEPAVTYYTWFFRKRELTWPRTPWTR